MLFTPGSTVTKNQTRTRNKSAQKETNAQSQAVSAQPDITSSDKNDLEPVTETGKVSKPEGAAASTRVRADETTNNDKEKPANQNNPGIATEKLTVVVKPAPQGTEEAKLVNRPSATRASSSSSLGGITPASVS